MSGLIDAVLMTGMNEPKRADDIVKSELMAHQVSQAFLSSTFSSAASCANSAWKGSIESNRHASIHQCGLTGVYNQELWKSLQHTFRWSCQSVVENRSRPSNCHGRIYRRDEIGVRPSPAKKDTTQR